MWYVAQFMQGLSVDEALKQLSFIKGKGAIIAKEVNTKQNWNFISSKATL